MRGLLESATRQKRGKEAIVQQLQQENKTYGDQLRQMRTLNSNRK